MNNFVGYKSNAISRAPEYESGGVHYGKKGGCGGEVTKNLLPSETNHLGTFCDSTREDRGSSLARHIFQYSRNHRRAWQIIKRDDDVTFFFLSSCSVEKCNSIYRHCASIYMAPRRDFIFQ